MNKLLLLVHSISIISYLLQKLLLIMTLSSLNIQRTPESRLESTDFNNLKFGDVFSDHMFLASFKNGTWKDFTIKPYGPIQIMPSATILHYGQGVFEGMKAFSYTNNKISVFRAEQHFERFSRSCSRMNIPQVPKELFFEALIKLIDLDRAWVPKNKFKSLYIRPFVVGSDEFLGLKTADSYRFMIITGPVGNYYSEGIKPIKLTTMPDYVRAVKGGVGDAKVPGNYAASLLPTHLAREQGYTQVMWLDAIEHEYIEEVGSMNMFFVVNGKVITPFLGGTILPGVTRRTVVELCKHHGIPVEERRVSITELIEAHKNGNLTEAFGSGTAAVISPVGFIHHNGYNMTLNQQEMGPIAQKLYNTITSIHHGEIKDEFGWCTLI